MLKDPENTVHTIRNKLDRYITDNKIKSFVIGVSGGIDSALCCALAKPLCYDLDISLIGRSLPIETNKKDECDRADLVGEAFCTDYEEKDLTLAYQQFIEFACPEIYSSEDKLNMKIDLGNFKARSRMMYLYYLARKSKGLVLSTDNLTELYLGFWTLHGDVGDLGMIQGLWKHEVYQLAKCLMDMSPLQEEREALFRCIKAVPTDGLGISDSDLDQIGAKSYDEVDMVLDDFIFHGEDEYCPVYDTPIVQRYIHSKFKRDNPYNFKREDII